MWTNIFIDPAVNTDMNFYQMCDKLNGGRPYEGLPAEYAPVKPRFMDYVKFITNGSKVMTADDGDWTFKTLTHEDTARHGEAEVLAYQNMKMQNDKLEQQRAAAKQEAGKFFNPTRNLGAPMNDQEYRDFMGITW